jgi:hypothetical protein
MRESSRSTSLRTGVSTFASPTSPSTDQSLQKSFHLSSPDKIELKKISSPSENKKYATAQFDTTKTAKRSIYNGFQGRWTEGQLITAVWHNGGFSASYDSFVSKQTVVLRISICGENPPLRQAANRQVVKKLKMKASRIE